MYRLSLFGPFHITTVDGTDVTVSSKKARALLAFLACTPGKPRSREEILALLWSDREEAQGRGSLRQVLTGLRKDVGDDLLIIDRDSVALNTDLVELSPPNGDEFLAGFHLADPAFEDWLRDERLRLEDAAVNLTTTNVTAFAKPTVAVLPFENLSSDPDQGFLSDGITEDVATELSRFNDIVIQSPRSTFAFRSKDISAKEIGQKLNVDYVVEGSVRQVADRLRISANLTETATDTQIWAKRFDGDLNDVFAVQEDVALKISTNISDRIFDQSYLAASRLPPSDLTAQQCVLMGEWVSFHQYGAPEALAWFEKAVARDPNCARGYANLANWHSYHSNFVTPASDYVDLQAQVRSYGQKALDLDPLDAIIKAWVAGAYCYIGDHEQARALLEKAILANSNHVVTMLYAAMILAWQGETQRSLKWLDRYLENSGRTYTSDGEILFEVYYLAGRFDDAIAAIAAYPDKIPEITAEVAAAYAQAGRLEEAETLRKQFEETRPEGYTFQDHLPSILRLCAYEPERERWLEGYRKAGFV
ncbi:MAG: hypothetical protein AAF754_17590 [Pseudomonadota bacterium]